MGNQSQKKKLKNRAPFAERGALTRSDTSEWGLQEFFSRRWKPHDPIFPNAHTGQKWAGLAYRNPLPN
jgi:hypothetical protein